MKQWAKLWLNYFLCARALWTLCVSQRLVSQRHNHCPAEGPDLLRAAAGQMWEAAGHCSPWPGAAPSLLWLAPPHICQKDQVCHPLKVRRGKPYRKWDLVNPHWFGRRMWPVVGSSWKRWHFTPAQDSIPDHSSCLPTDIRATLPKKEIIWGSFGSLNWLATVSEKHQDKEVAGKRIRAVPGSAALPPSTAGAWLALGLRPTCSSGGSCVGC